MSVSRNRLIVSEGFYTETLTFIVMGKTDESDTPYIRYRFSYTPNIEFVVGGNGVFNTFATDDDKIYVLLFHPDNSDGLGNGGRVLYFFDIEQEDGASVPRDDSAEFNMPERNIYEIAVDDSYIYGLRVSRSLGNAIYRWDKSDFSAEGSIGVLGAGFLGRLAVDDTYIYYFDLNDNRIRRYQKSALTWNGGSVNPTGALIRPPSGETSFGRGLGI